MRNLIRKKYFVLLCCLVSANLYALETRSYLAPGVVGFFPSVTTGKSSVGFNIETATLGLIPLNIGSLIPIEGDISLPLADSKTELDSSTSVFFMLGVEWNEQWSLEWLAIPKMKVPINASIPSFSYPYFVSGSNSIEVVEGEGVEGGLGQVEFFILVLNLTYQYHMTSSLYPYWGGGFYLLLARDTELSSSQQVQLGDADIRFENPVAPFLQLGLLWPWKPNWQFFIDTKWMQFDTALKIENVQLTTSNLDTVTNADYSLDLDIRASSLEIGMRYYF